MAVAVGGVVRNRLQGVCFGPRGVVDRPLPLAARRGSTANQMLARRLPARARTPTLRCRARQVFSSVLQTPPRQTASSHGGHHRLSRCWDVTADGTSKNALVRWAQHKRHHRLPGRSLRLWTAATASRQGTSTCRVATVRHVHGASSEKGDQPGAEAPTSALLFSPGQFRVFVKRYGPMALGTIHGELELGYVALPDAQLAVCQVLCW